MCDAYLIRSVTLNPMFYTAVFVSPDPITLRNTLLSINIEQA